MEGMIRQEKSVCYWLVFDKVNEMFFQLSYQCLIPLYILLKNLKSEKSIRGPIRIFLFSFSQLFTEQVVDHFVERSVYNFILCLIA